jgi:RimJ/RimL family protein N-acetyltransferase
MLLLQAPEAAPTLVTAALQASGRPATGLIGPREQVDAVRPLFAERQTKFDSPDILFALRMSELKLPPPLAAKELVTRAPKPAEFDLIASWRAAYEEELFDTPATPEARARHLESTPSSVDAGETWVAERNGELVAMTALNARLPECIQVGGVYCPPALRRRGYARAAVAGHLLHYANNGVERAILFTGEDNVAQRAYRAIGFESIGTFGLLMFAA